MTLPKTYKAAVFEKANAPFVFKDIELKQPSAGEVLVKVLACGVCHSDSIVRSGAAGNSFPIVPGHELIGNVAAVPEGEKKWKVGDRVGGPWHGGHDGLCKRKEHRLFSPPPPRPPRTFMYSFHFWCVFITKRNPRNISSFPPTSCSQLPPFAYFIYFGYIFSIEQSHPAS